MEAYHVCCKRVFDPDLTEEFVCVLVLGQAVLRWKSRQWGLHEIKAREPEPTSEAISIARWGQGQEEGRGRGDEGKEKSGKLIRLLREDAPGCDGS